MKNTCLLAFQVLKVLFIKEYEIYTASLPVPLFLVVLHHIRIYISRYHFYNFLEPNPTFTEKKDFRHEFSFFNGFT